MTTVHEAVQNEKNDKGQLIDSVMVALCCFGAKKILTDSNATSDILKIYFELGNKTKSIQDEILDGRITPIFNVPINQRADLVRVASVLICSERNPNWIDERILAAIKTPQLLLSAQKFHDNLISSLKQCSNRGQFAVEEDHFVFKLSGRDADYLYAHYEEWGLLRLLANDLYTKEEAHGLILNAVMKIKQLLYLDYEISEYSRPETVFANISIPKNDKNFKSLEETILDTLKDEKALTDTNRKIYINPFEAYTYILSKSGIVPESFYGLSSICKQDMIEAMEAASIAIYPIKEDEDENIQLQFPQNTLFNTPNNDFLKENKKISKKEKYKDLKVKKNSGDSLEVTQAYLNALLLKYIARKYQSDVIATIKKELNEPTNVCIEKKNSEKDISTNDLMWKKEKEEFIAKIAILEKENNTQWEQLKSIKNREAAMQARYEKLLADKVELEESIQELQKLVPITSIDSEEIKTTYSEVDISEVDYKRYLTSFFKKYGVVIVGGHNNIINKFITEYPDVTALPLNRIGSCDSTIRSADVVLLKTDYINHSFYNKVKSIASKMGIPVGYVDKSASVDYMAKSVYSEIKRIDGLMQKGNKNNG